MFDKDRDALGKILQRNGLEEILYGLRDLCQEQSWRQRAGGHADAADHWVELADHMDRIALKLEGGSQ